MVHLRSRWEEKKRGGRKDCNKEEGHRLDSLGGDNAGNRGLRQTLLRDAAGAEMAGGGGSSDC